MLGTFLQSLWAPALWLFLRMAGVRRSVIVPILGFCILSGFFFLNSFYVWPNFWRPLCSCWDFLCGPCPVPERTWNRQDATLGAAAIALGIVSHTGVLLAAPGIALVLYFSGKLPARLHHSLGCRGGCDFVAALDTLPELLRSNRQ